MYQHQISAPALYLNPLAHEGKQFIRIWHKPNPFISKRLKEAAWLKYSTTYKCFVMHHTPQAIEMTCTHFQGLAKVNTRYLHRPKRLKPGKLVPVLSGTQLCEPLQKLPELPVVRLQPMLGEGGATVISIIFRRNHQLYSLLRHSRQASWQKEQRCFAIPAGGQSIQALADELQGAGWLWLSQELQVKDVALMRTLWEQTYEKENDYITCPLPYLEKLFLLNYSGNTLRTYHALLLRFLNAHREIGLEAVEAFTEEDINRYHRSMVQGQQYSCSFVNQSINAVKFY